MTIAGNRQLLQQLVAEGKLKPAPSVSPIVPPTAYPIPDLVPTLNPLLRSPMPASTLFDTDIARQFHHQAIPQQRILPLSAATSPLAGAQAASQSIFIQQGGGGGLLLETNSQRNPSQGVLNLIAGSGVQVTSDRFGGVTIAGGDGLVHGDTIWDSDPAYTILRDDFIAGNATSGTIGDLGWIFGVNGTAVAVSQKADSFPYLGQFQFGPNAATTNTGGGIVLPAANLGLNSTGVNSMWPLLDYPGWKCTWVFTLRRPLSANPISTPFDATKLSLYVGVGNMASTNSFFTRPPGFIGVRYDTDPGSFALTSVAAASGGNTVYTGSALNLLTNQLAGFSVVISGFTNGVNNGTFTVVSNTLLTITVNNAAGAAETHAGTAVCAALALSDSTYVLEACFNPIVPNITPRINDQGTNGGTHNTGVAVVENAYHRVDISCVTPGQVIVSFDGVATTLTVTKPSTLRNTSVQVGVGDGFSLFAGTPSNPTKTDGFTGAGPGTVFTVSGLSGGLAVDNGTYTNLGSTSTDGLYVQQTLTSGIPANYTVTNYPALMPMAWITNDSSAAGSSNNTNRSLAVDYFSFVWNKGLAGGSPSSSNPRYW